MGISVSIFPNSQHHIIRNNKKVWIPQTKILELQPVALKDSYMMMSSIDVIEFNYRKLKLESYNLNAIKHKLVGGNKSFWRIEKKG